MRILDTFEEHDGVHYLVAVSRVDIAYLMGHKQVPAVEVLKFIRQLIASKTKVKGARQRWRQKANRKWRAMAG